ncbi:cupin domain-containing protein [Novosphingobium sp. BL-52-GroH]|uniref:cupin domain-containing protein n=1 Tax=Novosphingobium sp. BL-52-GroH TaxID=3349877 RepID=UPI003850D605
MPSKTLNIALLALGLTLSGQAMAAECPEADRKETALSGAPDKPTGATQGASAAIDLGPEIGVAGRALRFRQVTLAPGASVPAHSHQGRPSIMYVLSGEATEYSSKCRIAVVHRAGDTIREIGGFSHWWKNAGTVPTVLIVSEVAPTQ